MKSTSLLWLCSTLVFCLLIGSIAPSLAESGSGAPSSTTASAKNTAAKPPATASSAAEIAAAKASGQVWVNLQTGIYHKGGRWFGKTKDGKFMTVADAKKAGYKPSKR